MKKIIIFGIIFILLGLITDAGTPYIDILEKGVQSEEKEKKPKDGRYAYEIKPIIKNLKCPCVFDPVKDKLIGNIKEYDFKTKEYKNK